MNDKITLDCIELMHSFQFTNLPNFQKTMGKSAMQLKHLLDTGKLAVKNATYPLLELSIKRFGFGLNQGVFLAYYFNQLYKKQSSWENL